MKIPKLKKLQKVEVYWLDSNGDSGWKNENIYNDDSSMENKTCAYFLKETKLGINLIQNYQLFTDDKKEHHVDNFIQIPKIAITKIKKLK